MKTTFRPLMVMIAASLALSACDRLPNYGVDTGSPPVGGNPFPSTGPSVTVPSGSPISSAQPTVPPSGTPSSTPSTGPSTDPSVTPTASPSANPTPSASAAAGSDGPGVASPPPVLRGNATIGKDVFRFETFGNEGFWTTAARLPAGIVKAGLTPVQALKAGLHVDIEALSPDVVAVVANELKTDLSPANAPTLNNPSTTIALINANAVIGVVPKDTNKDGKIDVLNGDQVGVSCALCHGVTDRSAFNLPTGGSIGKRVDGPATTTINIGAILAMADNSRAFYPAAQLASSGNVGRAPSGLTKSSTEAEFDAYFSNPEYYPVGTFDDTMDGNGNSVKNPPFFEQDLAGPYGSAGEIAKLEDFSNVVFSVLFDPTSLTTPQGRQFLQARAGSAGTQLADDYASVLSQTNVTGYPFVVAQSTGMVSEASLTGRRVDNQKLLDLNSYVSDLKAPEGVAVDPASAMRGREHFRSNCTQCHNVNQNVPVPPVLTPLLTVWPAYSPVTAGMRGDTSLSAILNSPGTFDDKLIIIDASPRQPRGNALPLLMDLAPPYNRTFLKDASVPSLENLLDPSRGATAPHPFYRNDSAERADLVNFLKSLDSDF